MSGGNKKYKPKAFESDGRSNDTSANIYESMLCSEAWKDLKITERNMYVCMKAQYYGKRKPKADNKGLPTIDDQCFYFPFHLAERYGLSTNRTSFYERIKTLEEHGFIKTVINGKVNQQRSIYKYSADWKRWKRK